MLRGQVGHRCMTVVAHPPAGIPRQAEGNHWFAAQQRLKAHMRSDAIHFIHRLQQRNRVHILSNQTHIGLLRQIGQITALFAAQHIRMGFHPDFRLRVFLHSRLKHGFKRGRIRAAVLNCHIAESLIDEQHDCFFRRPIGYQAV